MTCNHCGHEHTGPELGGICIGCPCPHVVGGFDHDAWRCDADGRPWPCSTVRGEA